MAVGGTIKLHPAGPRAFIDNLTIMARSAPGGIWILEDLAELTKAIRILVQTIDPFDLGKGKGKFEGSEEPREMVQS